MAAFAAALLVGQGAVAGTVSLTFDFTGGIVSWVAPVTTTYRITAEGAQGAAGDNRYRGGRGARLSADFLLTAGDVFRIAVGGVGRASSPSTGNGSGGGGGGTFFVGPGSSPLLIAGGGGGTRANVLQNGTDASVTTSAYRGSGSASTYTPSLKGYDVGRGGRVSASSYGAAGAGFYSNGQADGLWGTGGSSWFAGLTGGRQTSSCSYGQALGGFGGGGAGNGCWGGGGGGGYSGGDGGRLAGGGGSFNSGTNTSALAGVGYGNGHLSISYTLPAPPPAPVPLPASAMLLASAFVVLMLRRRVRKAEVPVQ